MRTTLTAVAAAATIAVATIAAPTAADARRGWWAPAIIGGLAAGAIIGSAYARPYYGGYGYYQPAPVVYRPAPVYYNPPPVVVYRQGPAWGYGHHHHHGWRNDGWDRPGGRRRAIPRGGFG